MLLISCFEIDFHPFRSVTEVYASMVMRVYTWIIGVFFLALGDPLSLVPSTTRYLCPLAIRISLWIYACSFQDWCGLLSSPWHFPFLTYSYWSHKLSFFFYPGLPWGLLYSGHWMCLVYSKHFFLWPDSEGWPSSGQSQRQSHYSWHSLAIGSYEQSTSPITFSTNYVIFAFSRCNSWRRI